MTTTSTAMYATVAELDSGINAAALAGVDTTSKTTGLVDASSIIDSYLGSEKFGVPRYTLPLVSWGGDLRRACLNIATYFIMVGRGYNPDAGSDPGIRDRYLDSIAWLKDVANGIASPAGAIDSSLPPVDPGGIGGGGAFGSPLVISSSSRGYSSRGSPNGRTGPFQGD
jgi:phage gp36-like protein